MRVALGDVDNKSKVCLDKKLLAGFASVTGVRGTRKLLFRPQQGNPTDALKPHRDRVVIL